MEVPGLLGDACPRCRYHHGMGSTIKGAAGDGADTIVLTGEADPRTTSINDFLVGKDMVDVSDLLDIDADDIDVAIAAATVTGTFADGDITCTIDLAPSRRQESGDRDRSLNGVEFRRLPLFGS